MSAEKIGYKVVRKLIDGRFISYLGSNNTLYSTKTYAKPASNAGPLCVFKSRKSARDFQNDDGSILKSTTRIFKVRYTPSSLTRVWRPGSYAYGWGLNTLPESTVLADSVILLEDKV